MSLIQNLSDIKKPLSRGEKTAFVEGVADELGLNDAERAALETLVDKNNTLIAGHGSPREDGGMAYNPDYQNEIQAERNDAHTKLGSMLRDKSLLQEIDTRLDQATERQR